MNHHLRFAMCLPLAAPLLTSCQSTEDRLLSLSESVPPQLAKDDSYIRFQCYFFTAPDDFHLLENTEGAHAVGIFSPSDGAKLVESIQRRRGFDFVTTPSIVSRQGQTGTIEIIREFIYPTEYSPPVIPKDLKKVPEGAFPVTPAVPTKFEKVNTGITAKLKGKKSPKGNLAIEFDLKVTNFLGFVNYGSPITTSATTAFGKPVDVIVSENRIEMPVFDTKRLASKLTLAPGQYVAIGGLRADPQPQLLERIEASSGTKVEKDQNLFALITVEAIGPDGR